MAFVTHGLVVGALAGISEPAPVLTLTTKATETDDGLLTASEVAQLKLDADSVILSACNTAAADGTPGANALSGLAIRVEDCFRVSLSESSGPLSAEADPELQR